MSLRSFERGMGLCVEESWARGQAALGRCRLCFYRRKALGTWDVSVEARESKRQVDFLHLCSSIIGSRKESLDKRDNMRLRGFYGFYQRAHEYLLRLDELACAHRLGLSGRQS